MSKLVGITLSVAATESAAVFLCLTAILCICGNGFFNHYE